MPDRYKLSIRRTESRINNELVGPTKLLLTVVDLEAHETHQFTVTPKALAEFLFDAGKALAEP